jgi:quercetin dioxygenase-like cupin family protein
MSSTVVNWSELQPREVIPGFVGRFAHSERMTFALWEIAEGAILPEHDHEHEQVIHVLQGRLEVTVSGETTVLSAGLVGMVPPFARHSGRALSDCRVLDVFAPVREDYRSSGGDGVLERAMGQR